MMENGVTSEPVPEEVGMATKKALVPHLGERVDALADVHEVHGHVHRSRSSGCSYMVHMILPASMAEPPPMAMMQSGLKARSSSRPFRQSCSLGSGEMDQKLVWVMPCSSRDASIFLVKPEV